jgi:hypothetical protein
MEIRDATPGDVEAIRNVHRPAIRELGTEAYTEEQVDAWARGCDSANYTATRHGRVRRNRDSRDAHRDHRGVGQPHFSACSKNRVAVMG